MRPEAKMVEVYPGLCIRVPSVPAAMKLTVREAARARAIYERAAMEAAPSLAQCRDPAGCEAILGQAMENAAQQLSAAFRRRMRGDGSNSER